MASEQDPTRPGHPSLRLEMGGLEAIVGESVLSAVTGCSVVVTLHSPARSCGGMCHFNRPKGKDHELTTHHGNGAILELARRMKALDCSSRELQAQIVGGASIPGMKGCESLANIKMAERLLKRFGVQVISRDTGGHLGRKILFNTRTGEVVVMKTAHLRQSDWICRG